MKKAVTNGAVQWQVTVSKDTDAEARDFLRSQGLQESDVSVLVEDAIHMYVFQRTMRDIQERNASADADELQGFIDEAVSSVRREMHSARS